jgi:ubiquinone/menaquinone biosynthesis C-methylase UbiE
MNIPEHEMVRNVFCCPACLAFPLRETENSLSCAKCAWKSLVVGSDTLAFNEKVYDRGQTQTKERPESKSAFIQKARKFNAWVQGKIIWRKYIFGDDERLAEFITSMRAEEMRVIEGILDGLPSLPVDMALEVGVGSQDHRSLYNKVARRTICSDIYRDSKAVQFYQADPNVFYAIMNIDRLPLRESSIDFVFTSHVAEHFPNRSENLKSLKKILKPGSLSCHVVPTRTWVILGHLLETILNILTLRPRIGARMHGEYDGIVDEICQTSVQRWTKGFEEAGFEVIVSRPGTLGIYPLRHEVTSLIGRFLGVYGSHVFIMRTAK